MDIDILDAIEKASGRLEKEALLKRVSPSTVSMLKWALDPMITFGVTADQDAYVDAWRATSTRMSVADFWKSLDTLCQHLSDRELTGNNAAEVVARLAMSGPTERHTVWMCRVLNKDLRCGVQVATLNNVFPGSIEKEIPCSLAVAYDPDKHDLRGEWCVEPKLDGLRMVVISGKAYTRNGRTIDTVGHIIDELFSPAAVAHGGDEYVYDGEIMGKTDFDQDSGKIRKKGNGPNRDLVYNVFDMLTLREWRERKSEPLNVRKMRMHDWLGTLCPKNTQIVPMLTLSADASTEELFATRDRFIKAGYEGAMLKDFRAPYVFKRSASILKLKDFSSADGVIKSWYEGRGRHKGRLGGFVVEFDGVETRVGGGYNDQQRTELWAKRDQMVGKWLEAEYQNKTTEGSLRFPVFLKFRPDREKA